MRIAVFSPLNPMQSGISDFTEEVVLKLREHIYIDLFVDGYIPENPDIVKNFTVYNFEDIEDPEIRKQYDHIIYHVGNHEKNHGKIVDYCLKYPGIIELHDYTLQHLLAEMTLTKYQYIAYVLIMLYCHGEKGEAAARNFISYRTKEPWLYQAMEFPVNKHILEKATGIIVHSDYVKQLVKDMRLEAPVEKISIHSNDIIEDYEAHQIECRIKLGIDTECIIFASFGHATPNKRINEILEALSLLKRKDADFKYYIVGEPGIDNIEKKLEETDLSDRVHITGHVPMEKFLDHMGACDICFNLRYPTQGESSASLHRALGMGKPVFVTKIGSFNEYPDNTVVKIDADENEVQSIYKELQRLMTSDNEIQKRKVNSIKYIKENCSLEKNCIKYTKFLREIYGEKN